MTDAELISQLQQLKNFTPSPKTLAALEVRVQAGRTTQPALTVTDRLRNFVGLFRLRPVIITGLLALCLLLGAVAGRGELVPQTQALWSRARVALASNRYQQAQLSLKLSQTRLSALHAADDQDLNLQLAYLTDSLSQTNRAVHSLSLVGEPNKYTMRQCLETYQAYGKYLDSLQSAIQEKMFAVPNQETRNRLLILSNQVVDYDQQVDEKLQQY